MRSNSFGKAFSITSFGESHGKAVGVIIDGCPANLELDLDLIQLDLERRKPGQSELSSSRKEDDKAEIISGIFEGKTTGAPICILIKNKDHKPEDYDEFKNSFRPSHADYSYSEKYGIRDHRGGGRSSARITASWVAAGAIAKMILRKENISIHAAVTSVGDIHVKSSIPDIDFSNTEDNPVRCPDPNLARQMEDLILKLKQDGDTVGGSISCRIDNCPTGLGEPIFDKLQSDLAKAMLNINAVKGFEYGSGFQSIEMKGSEHNDPFRSIEGSVQTVTNNSGGIQGGISNGMPIYFRLAFKPVATIMMDQQTVDLDKNELNLKAKGRHDPCVVPRAVPIVEAMAAIVICDHLLRSRLSKL